MDKNRVSAEQAKTEFLAFAEAMDISLERKTEEGRKGIQQIQDFIVEHITAGRLEFNSDNEPVVNLWRTRDMGPLTVCEPTGANLMAAGVEESEFKAQLKILAELTKQSVSSLSKLKAGEIKLLRTLLGLFTM